MSIYKLDFALKTWIDWEKGDYIIIYTDAHDENLLLITIILNLMNKGYLKLSSLTAIPDERHWKLH